MLSGSHTSLNAASLLSSKAYSSAVHHPKIIHSSTCKPHHHRKEYVPNSDTNNFPKKNRNLHNVRDVPLKYLTYLTYNPCHENQARNFHYPTLLIIGTLGILDMPNHAAPLSPPRRDATASSHVILLVFSARGWTVLA